MSNAVEISAEFEIVNQSGLHLRPAAAIVKLSAKFSSEIMLEKDGLLVSAKSIMGITTLEGNCGELLTVIARGEDAEAAVAALGELIANKFGEE